MKLLKIIRGNEQEIEFRGIDFDSPGRYKLKPEGAKDEGFLGAAYSLISSNSGTLGKMFSNLEVGIGYVAFNFNPVND